MDIENDENAMGAVDSSAAEATSPPDQMEQTSQYQLSPGREVPPDHQREDARLVGSSAYTTITTGEVESPSLSAGEGEPQTEPGLGGAGEDEGEEEDLAVQVYDLEVLPSDSDDGVRHHMDQIGDKFNIKHVLRCLLLYAEFLRIAGNVLATDAMQLVKVQELQFEVIKLCDSVSLMLQSDQSGANNILEKLKIAYLYLQDGFPDFAKTDIDVISKDVKSMEEATQKCLGKIKAAKRAEETVLEMVKGKKVERESKVASLCYEIKQIKQQIASVKIKGPQRRRPISDPNPSLPGSSTWSRAWWTMTCDIAWDASLQMGLQAARQLTGLKSPTLGIVGDMIENQCIINIVRTFKSNQRCEEEQNDENNNKVLRNVLHFATCASVCRAFRSEAPWRQLLELIGGFGIPAGSLYLRRTNQTTPPKAYIFPRREDLESCKRLSRPALAFTAVGCIFYKFCPRFFPNFSGRAPEILEKIKTMLDGPFLHGMCFFIFVCIVKRLSISDTSRDLPRLEANLKLTTGTVAPSTPEIEIYEDELAYMREELAKAVDNVFISLLAIKVIEKSLPLLDDKAAVLDYATTLVKKWYTECKEIVEPNMQHNIDRAEGLSVENKRKYWDSLFFKKEVKGYYERWRALQVFCERNRPALKSTRQRAESHYTENLYPRDAVKKAWELAAEEPDEDIRALVVKRREWLKARDGCGGRTEMVVPF